MMTDTSGKPTEFEMALASIKTQENKDRLPSVICSAFEPLSWSAEDTRQTVVELKRHNRKWLRVCDPEKYGKLARGQDDKS